jgi:hypothetical protein
MFIERICPGLVPAIRQAFAVPELVKVDDAVRTLVTFGDCMFLMGVLSVFLVGLVVWLVRDVVRFVRFELAYRRKNAA